VNSAIFGEATGKRGSVLRPFGGQIVSDWFGTSRAMLFSSVQLHSQKFRRILAK
jgi:hypothetical protein